MAREIKILVADDHDLIREGVKSLLESEEDIKVILEVNNGQEVIEQVDLIPEVDIVLMDINMPVIDGIEATRRIKDSHPEVGVLILSTYNKREFIKNLVSSGADGYILKNSGKASLIRAIRAIASGGSYYDMEITKTMMSTEFMGGYDSNIDVDLSDREKEVIKLIAEEYSTSQIAEKLFISRHTVDSHRKNVLSKLDVKNVAGIIKYAIQTGIVKDYNL